MLPTLLKIGPLTLHSYGVMLATAFLVTLHLMRRHAQKVGFDPDIVADGAFWTLIVGLAGTRVLHIILFPGQYSWTDPVGWVAIWRGGLVFQGALPACALFLYFYLRRKGKPFLKTLDMFAPYLPLCHGIGRLGCFLNGCCYGRRTDFFLGIPFRRVPWDTSIPPEGSLAFIDHCNRYGVEALSTYWGKPFSEVHWSFPVHATQLYSSIALFLIFLILLQIRKRARNFDGVVLCSYLLLYSVFRFFNEFLRGDHNPQRLGGLSDQQVVCILSVLVVGALLVVLWARRPRLAPDDEDL